MWLSSDRNNATRTTLCTLEDRPQILRAPHWELPSQLKCRLCRIGPAQIQMQRGGVAFTKLYSAVLSSGLHLRLTINHGEAHAGQPGMLLDPLCQRLRMSCNPELSGFRCANDKVGQRIDEVRMQTSLRFVEGQ